MIYLDNAATSYPKAPGLGQGIAWHINNIAGNTGRSSYSGAVYNSKLIYETREKLSDLLGCPDSSQFIFTNNATHALNTAILGSIEAGERILVSPLEHNSVMRPLTYLQEKIDVKVFYYKLNKEFEVDWKNFQLQLQHNKITKVITTICSNVTGTILPVKQISELCACHRIPLIIDASQYIGYKKFDLTEIQASAVCFPGHKGLLGPSGTGLLWLNPDFHLDPIMFGGTGSKSDSIHQPNFLPDKYESGTPNISGLYGLSLALDYINKQGFENISKAREEIVGYLFHKIQEIEEIIIYSNLDLARQVGVLSFNQRNIPCSEVTHQLDRNEIAVRMGLHCAPQAHKFIGTYDLGGTVRISPSSFTTVEEIDKTIKILKEISYGFKR